jgi:hypothetical protein
MIFLVFWKACHKQQIYKTFKRVISEHIQGTNDMKVIHILVPIIKILILVIGMLSIMEVSVANDSVHSNKSNKTTILLIRHAERDNFFNITDEGRKRADALIASVADMGILAIYSPDLSRNLETVKPLANYLEIEITLIPRINKASLDEILGRILTPNKGKVVLLVGNGSGNLTLLHQRLGGQGDGPYQYGQLNIYCIYEDGSVSVTKSKFGI